MNLSKAENVDGSFSFMKMANKKFEGTQISTPFAKLYLTILQFK